MKATTVCMDAFYIGADVLVDAFGEGAFGKGTLYSRLIQAPYISTLYISTFGKHQYFRGRFL